MINWNAVGAIGEVLGAVTVLATLIYLALQIRQNTRQQRFESARALTEEFNRLNSLWYDPEKAEMFAHAIDNWDGATIQEQTVAFTFLMQYSQHMQTVFEMWGEEMISNEVYEAEETALLSTLTSGGGAQWWAGSQEMYGSKFVARINHMLVVGEYPKFVELLPHLDGQRWPRPDLSA
jgi:hypothetical protein